MVTEAQKRAEANYRKKCAAVTVRFYGTDADLLAFVNAHPNKQGYIKDLIRADMCQNAPKR